MLNHLNWVESLLIKSLPPSGVQRCASCVRMRDTVEQVCALDVMLACARVCSTSPGE